MKKIKKGEFTKFASVFLTLTLLVGCQTLYDIRNEHEERTFCDHIENRNHPQCTGNHMPLPPNK